MESMADSAACPGRIAHTALQRWASRGGGGVGQAVGGAVLQVKQHARAGCCQCQQQHLLHLQLASATGGMAGISSSCTALPSSLTAAPPPAWSAVCVRLCVWVPPPPLPALLQISGALATVLVGKRKTSPTTETKPGKAPKVGRQAGRRGRQAGGHNASASITGRPWLVAQAQSSTAALPTLVDTCCAEGQQTQSCVVNLSWAALQSPSHMFPAAPHRHCHGGAHGALG